MVVGEIPFVPLLLPKLLGGNDSFREERKALLPQEVAGHISAPGHGVTLVKRPVQRCHEFLNRNVVAGFEAPLVGSFQHKPLTEGMMRITGQAHILIQIETKPGGKRLGRIGLPFIDKGLRAFPHILVYHRLNAFLPVLCRLFVPEWSLLFRGKTVQFLFIIGPDNRFDGALQFREENFEVGIRIPGERPRQRHSFLRADAVLPDNLQHVITGTAFRNLAVAVHTHIMCRVVHVVLVHHKHLAQIVRLPRFAENLTLKITQRGVIPARTAAVLVLHAGYREFPDGGKRLRHLRPQACSGQDGCCKDSKGYPDVFLHNIKTL